MADYYNSQFSGKEVDDAIEKIRSIIANPSESATLDLDKITINGVIYNVGAYHITLTSNLGTITQEQYNSLAANENSYVIFQPGAKKEMYQLSEIYSDELHLSSVDSQSQMVIYANSLQCTIWSDPSEKTINKTNTISAESTNVQYPSAKAVYDFVYSMIVGALNTEV